MKNKKRIKPLQPVDETTNNDVIKRCTLMVSTLTGKPGKWENISKEKSENFEQFELLLCD